MNHVQQKHRRPRRLLLGGLGLATISLGAALGLPPRTAHLRSTAQPCRSYTDALERFAALQARDDVRVHPRCHSRLLTHGDATDSVVVLLHGMTNCPLQLEQLGGQLHQAGHTVLIPRLPQNGLADRRTTALSRLRAADLAACGDEAVDIACGLGRRIVVFGLSAGGLVAAWVAQHRAEVDRAVIAAPAFGISTFAPPVQAVLRNFLLRLPNQMLEDGAEELARKPEHTYIRKSTRSLGELLLLGESVLRGARDAAPAAAHVVLMTNAGDVTINNELVDLLTARWKQHDPSRISRFEFSSAEGLGHDIIDPLEPRARPDFVYPIVQSLVES
jgi:esterase/lipase